MLLFLNIVIMIAFCALISIGCDKFDRALTVKQKLKCCLAMVIAGSLTGIALLVLYRVFGVTDDNLIYYLAYGKVR